VRIRIGRLLLLCAALLGACARPPPERPREGAPAGVEGRAARDDEGSASSPTPSPSAALGDAPLPLTTPGRQASNGVQAGTPAPLPSPSPAHVIVATDGAGANLRTGPSTAAPVVTTLAEGTLVEVLGDPVSAAGRSWRQVRSGDREGWVVAVVVRQR
jgi:hypothetical protein